MFNVFKIKKNVDPRFLEFKQAACSRVEHWLTAQQQVITTISQVNKGILVKQLDNMKKMLEQKTFDSVFATLKQTVNGLEAKTNSADSLAKLLAAKLAFEELYRLSYLPPIIQQTLNFLRLCCYHNKSNEDFTKIVVHLIRLYVSKVIVYCYNLQELSSPGSDKQKLIYQQAYITQALLTKLKNNYDHNYSFFRNQSTGPISNALTADINRLETFLLSPEMSRHAHARVELENYPSFIVNTTISFLKQELNRATFGESSHTSNLIADYLTIIDNPYNLAVLKLRILKPNYFVAGAPSLFDAAINIETVVEANNIMEAFKTTAALKARVSPIFLASHLEATQPRFFQNKDEDKKTKFLKSDLGDGLMQVNFLMPELVTPDITRHIDNNIYLKAFFENYSSINQMKQEYPNFLSRLHTKVSNRTQFDHDIVRQTLVINGEAQPRVPKRLKGQEFSQAEIACVKRYLRDFYRIKLQNYPGLCEFLFAHLHQEDLTGGYSAFMGLGAWYEPVFLFNADQDETQRFLYTANQRSILLISSPIRKILMPTKDMELDINLIFQVNFVINQQNSNNVFIEQVFPCLINDSIIPDISETRTVGQILFGLIKQVLE